MIEVVLIRAKALRGGDLFRGPKGEGPWMRVRARDGLGAVHYTDPRFGTGLGQKMWHPEPGEIVQIQRKRRRLRLPIWDRALGSEGGI